MCVCLHARIHVCTFTHVFCVWERGTENISKEKEKVKNQKCIYVTIAFGAGAYISHSGKLRYS